MAKVKVVVPLLNKRRYPVASTTDKSNIVGQVKEGFEFESIAETTNSLGNWYQDADGYYYWGGGVEVAVNSNFLLPWWITDFGIDKIWHLGFSGNRVKIAVLDTGISLPNDSLRLDISSLFDVTESEHGVYDKKYGHGTHCIGIIKANNESQNLKGIALNSHIFSIKITHESKGDKEYFMEDGINLAISKGADIISISKGDPTPKPKVEAAINKAFSLGKLVVVASGNRIDGYPNDHIYYPAKYSNALSVGGVDNASNPLSDSILTGETNIYAPGFEMLSTFISNKTKYLSGSSQAAAYMSGVCSLILEAKRRNEPDFKASEIKNLLLANSKKTDFGQLINLSNLF